MWRVVVRLTCIIMGGVLLVMTLGISWRRDDSMPSLMVLHRSQVRLVVYDPELKKQWVLGEANKSGYFGIADTGRFAFAGQQQGIYSRSLFESSPRQLSSHMPIRGHWSSDHHWLLFCEGVYEDSEVYALEANGNREFHLTRALPPNLIISAGRCADSRDGDWVAFTARDPYKQRDDVYRIHFDGSGLENLTADLPSTRLSGWPTPQDTLLIDEYYRVFLGSISEGTFKQLLDPAVVGDPSFRTWLPSQGLYVFFTDDLAGMIAVDKNGNLAWSMDWYRFPFGIRDTSIQVIQDITIRQFKFVETATGIVHNTQFDAQITEHRAAWSSKGEWVVFNEINKVTGQEELWRFDYKTRQFTRLWWTPGGDIFDVWVSPDGQEILVDAATPTWAGLLRMNPDGSDVRELTSVQDIELGEHDFVDWATLPDRTWQPMALAGIGLMLILVGIGWPMLRKIIPRRRRLLKF